MTGERIAIVDIGKTHAKVAFVEAHSGTEIWGDTHANRPVETPLGRQLDVFRQLRLFEQPLRYADATGVPDANNPGSGDHVITL